jgi:iron complex transport system ATP-binding protein
MLAGGEVVRDGPIDDALTADSLSECFALPLSLEKREGRFRAWSPTEGTTT